MMSEVKQTKGTFSNMKISNILEVFICIAMTIIPTLSAAESFQPFTIVDSKPISEVWLNPGFYSYHFQKNLDLDNNNYGIGIEYRYSNINAVTAGKFRNSNRDDSLYIGWYWQPFAIGPIRLGAVVGALDGYRKMNDGGWFIAAIPAASYEYRSVGANLILTPSYRDQLHGALSLQVKVKLY